MINNRSETAAQGRARDSDAGVPTAGDTAKPTEISVQVLRGIAALMIIFHHYIGTSVERGFAVSGLERAAVGNAGVDLFFLISGFIMEYTAGSRPFLPGDRGRFLLRRMARILPLYWTLTLIAYAIATFMPFVVNSSTSTKQLMYSMFLLPDGAAGSYVLPLAWTLTFEMLFYLLFAALLPLKPRQRLLGLAVLFVPSLVAPESVSAHNALLGIMLNPILFEFLAGVLLAQMLAAGVRIKPYVSVTLIVAGSAMLLSQLNHNVTDSMLRLWLWGGPTLLIVGAVVLADRAGEGHHVAAPVRLGAWIGDMSYSLYLSHFFAISMYAKAYYHYLINYALPPWLTGIGLFLFCLLVAQVCFGVFERPVRRSLNAWIESGRARVQVA